MNKYTLSYRFLYGKVQGCVCAKNRPVSINWTDYTNIYLGVDFSDTDFSLLTVGQLTVVIINDSIHDGTCHVFDSHLRAASVTLLQMVHQYFLVLGP